MSPAGQRCHRSRCSHPSGVALARDALAAERSLSLCPVSPSSQARPSAPLPSGSMSRSSRASRPTLRKLGQTGWIKCGRRREATSESRYAEPGRAARTGPSPAGLRGTFISSGVSIVCTTDSCPGFSDLELAEILPSQKVTVDKLTCKEN